MGEVERRNRPCSERVEENLRERVKDLNTLWQLYQRDPEASDEDLGNLYEYGLSFDYVSAGTFNDQERGYFRYQLSWGGPSDEFRFFVGREYEIDHIEYWFLDWGDGASVRLYGAARELLGELWEWFKDAGCAEHEWHKAMGIDEPKSY